MTIEQEYVEAAIAHEAGTDVGDEKIANQAAERLLKLRDRLYELADHGESVLTKLLAHPSSNVARWAASHLLPVNEEVAVRALERLAEEDGIGGFDALMTLQTWRTQREERHLH